VVIQENVSRKGDQITLNEVPDDGGNIRPAGSDYAVGDAVEAPRRLNARDLALVASMNHSAVPVYRKPVVAIIATGDELVMPGESPAPDQIIASNSFGLKAICEAEGADVRLLPIARDNPESLSTVLGLAAGYDLIVTIGGASVGDHDIVAKVAGDLGLERSFYKVAMRPGKPLMSGRIGTSTLIGLPGNPVSSMVCGHIFIVPALRAMQGLSPQARRRHRAVISHALGPNGPREHYMRATMTHADGQTLIDAKSNQDSSLLSVLSEANCLMVRQPNDPARVAGDAVNYLPL
jgi:molybdopterin molybdotransferase